jgi:hypothetical protein
VHGRAVVVHDVLAAVEARENRTPDAVDTYLVSSFRRSITANREPD